MNRPFVQTSVSQVETFEQCPRKWWLQKIQGLPQEDRDYFHFGTGLHAIIERWLMADDNGMLDGKPVDLYPEGWHKVRDDKQQVVYEYTISEQAWIKKLIALAIENGTLERRPGRELEKEFFMEIVPGIKAMGYVDVLLPDEVWDHKTAKSRKYAKGAKALEGNHQVLLYAKLILDRARKEGGALPEIVVVRHNVFLKDQKDPKPVYKVEVEVPRAAIDEHFTEFQQITRRMQQTALVEKLDDLPKPPEKACTDYGGCCYLTVCAGLESFDKYTTRVKLLNQARLDRFKPRTEAVRDTTGASRIMANLWEKLNPSAKAAPDAGSAAPALNPPAAKPPTAAVKAAPPPPPKAPPAAPPVPQTCAPGELIENGETVLYAPWYVLGCAACRLNAIRGFNSKGEPCRVCDAKAPGKGLPTSSSFRITGAFEWEQHEAAPSSAPPPPPAVERREEAAKIVAAVPAVLSPARVAAAAAVPEPGSESAEGGAEDLEVGDVTDAPPAAAAVAPPRRGRPPGSKNKTTAEVPAEPAQIAPADAAPVAVVGEGDEQDVVDESSVAVGLTAKTTFDMQTAVPRKTLTAIGQPSTVFNPTGAGRRKRRYTLMIGCVPTRLAGSTGKYILVEDIFAQVRARYEQEKKIATYWDVDGFKRRDAMSFVAQQLIDELGQATIVCTTSSASQDIKAFIDALRPYADTIVQSVIG